MKKFTQYEKILQVLDKKGISASKAEGILGFGQGIFSKLSQRKDGAGNLSKDKEEKFLRMFHVNPLWWKSNDGEMFLPDEIEVASTNPQPSTEADLRKTIAAMEKVIQFIELQNEELKRQLRECQEKYSGLIRK
jgi:hypothetical protein